MSATREQVMEALLAVLATALGTLSTPFVTISRRNQNPEGMDPTLTPALFLIESEDEWDRKQGYNILPKRALHAVAVVYTDVGQDLNAIPSTPVNNALDAIDVAFAPDNRMTNAFTLGGLVQAVTLDGKAARAPGDITGKALSVVPIRILLDGPTGPTSSSGSKSDAQPLGMP